LNALGPSFLFKAEALHETENPGTDFGPGEHSSHCAQRDQRGPPLEGGLAQSSSQRPGLERPKRPVPELCAPPTRTFEPGLGLDVEARKLPPDGPDALLRVMQAILSPSPVRSQYLRPGQFPCGARGQTGFTARIERLTFPGLDLKLTPQFLAPR